MPEPFDAIGFQIKDDASYKALAEQAHQLGALSKAHRPQGTLHGCCWSLGSGLEVWTVLYESSKGTFYADCRPAFRGKRQVGFYPWEILEYEEDGEAIVRGAVLEAERRVGHLEGARAVVDGLHHAARGAERAAVDHKSSRRGRSSCSDGSSQLVRAH